MSAPVVKLPLHLEAPPVRIDAGGAVRVGNTRVTLAVVIGQYENGMSPEEMVQAFDTLCLADVYGVIAWHTGY